MVHRAKAMRWLGFVAGVGFTAASAAAADPFDALGSAWALPRSEDIRICQAPGRLSRTQAALNEAIETYRKGDYEAAGQLFQQAQAGWGDLSPQQQADLLKFVQFNNTALEGRREASEQVRQAQQAEREGRGPAAADLAQKALANQYLTRADRVTAQALSDRWGGSSGSTQGSPTTLARTKLSQARQLLAQGNHDGAELLAREVERMKAPVGSGEDSAARVLEDIGKARNDPKSLVSAARAAYTQGDLETAETLARQAEKNQSTWTVHLWGDSPTKVLRDVQSARAAKQGEGTPTRVVAAKGPDSDPRPETTGILDGWRGLFSNRKAPADTIVVVPGEPRVADSTGMPREPKAMLQKAREAYAAGRLDEALQLAQRAKSAPGASWGLFDFDTPDKLINEVNKARGKRDQEEAARLLVDGRKMLERGDLDGAQKAALRSESLYKGYSVWDFGDRPQRLLDDVEAARKKTRGATASTATPPGSARPSTTPRGEEKPGNPSAQARALLAQARQFQREGKLVDARLKTLEAQRYPAVYSPDEDRPEKVLIDLAGQARTQIDNLVNQSDELAKRGLSDPRAAAEADARLTQAQGLAKAYQLDTHSLDSKLTALRQSASRVATGPALTGPGLAAPGMPTLPPVPGSTPAGPGVPAGQPGLAVATDGGPQYQGRELLTKARLEIRAGNTSMARRLVEDVYRGPYGLQADAEAMLRSIDAEEFEQKRRDARRTFEAGESAFRRREYVYAGSILRSLDVKMLEPNQQTRYRELMAVPELRQSQGDGIAVASAQAPAPQAPGVATVTSTPPTGGEDSREASYLKQVQAMQQVKFQKLREQGLKAQDDAMQRWRSGDTDRALEVLQEYLSVLPEADVDADQRTLLRRPVESRLTQYRTLKAQKDFDAARTQARESGHRAHAQKALTEQNKQKRIQELMGQYNTLIRDNKWSDAEGLALQALDLDPDNAIIATAVHTAKMRSRVNRYQDIKNENEAMVLGALNDAQREGRFVSATEPMVFDRDRWQTARKRSSVKNQIGGAKTEKAREIERRLLEPVRLNFTDTPLDKILDDVGTWQGINIFPDVAAMDEKGISIRRPVTIKLENVSLKTAMNLLLGQVGLTYVVDDEVLRVTTKEHARGRNEVRYYPVAELVVPLENGADRGPINPLDRSQHINLQPTIVPGTSPYASPGAMTSSGNAVGSPGSGFASNMPMQGASWQKSGPAQTREDELIRLITSSLSPNSWQSMGGQGTIDYFPYTMTLVINQTPDIQEQVADLLQALRRLHDVEVSVEVRLISIAEGFFERIGLDFNVNVKTDRNTSRFEPQITSGQFKPAGFLNDFAPDRFISGLTPAGTFTSDLDIPIRSSSFGMAIPPFGGFPNIPGGNGGIELGLAFLSDIQVFLFMEAAQGDQRTNVMQAPKLTLFNGQTATISVADQQFFVTNVQVINNNGQLTFQPNNSPFTTGGVGLTLQAVVSSDRRFVRLNFANFGLTNLASATVPLFPVPVVVTPSFEGGFQGQPVVFTQFLQQPVFNTINVSTTVAVPDGGTVMIGGLKRLSEGRNEFGPPVLSKIPYVNRLFKNVGYGREVQNFMMMVTPRIIINEEEERNQTGGYTAPRLEVNE